MLSSLSYVLWAALPILQGVIAYRMVSQKVHRAYPLFFAYTIEQILRFMVLFYLFHLGTREQYRSAYFGLEGIETPLQFSVICELFVHVFRPYPGIRQFASVVLRWATAALLLIAVFVAAWHTGNQFDKLLAGFFVLARSLYLVQGGLLFLLLIMASALGMSWEQPGLGIALGFGIFTAVDLAAFTLRVELGKGSHAVLSLISNAGFDCAGLVWLIALYTRKPVHKFQHQVPGWDVESWNRALLNLLRRPPLPRSSSDSVTIAKDHR
jgi:hypothetical protein